MSTLNSNALPVADRDSRNRPKQVSRPRTTSPTLPCYDSFLQNLEECILPCLHDSSLNIRKLLRRTGMSRSDLHRKLKAATGMSATEYIRHLRLRRAYELLNEMPELSVFCIAVEVGFNDHSYFTKRFREAFGVCPTRFRAENTEKED